MWNAVYISFIGNDIYTNTNTFLGGNSPWHLIILRQLQSKDNISEYINKPKKTWQNNNQLFSWLFSRPAWEIYVFTQNKYEIVTWVKTPSTAREAVLSYTVFFSDINTYFYSFSNILWRGKKTYNNEMIVSVHDTFHSCCDIIRFA